MLRLLSFLKYLDKDDFVKEVENGIEKRENPRIKPKTIKNITDPLQYYYLLVGIELWAWRGCMDKK